MTLVENSIAAQTSDPFLKKTLLLREKLGSELSDIMAMMISTSFYNMDEKLIDDVFKYGQVFKGQSMPHVSKRHSQMRACFQNCTNYTDNGTDAKLLYCEGWAFSKTLPVLHAWVNPEPGIAWDPTWQRNFENESVENNEYWGFAFKPGMLPHLLEISGVYGVLESPVACREIWTNPGKWFELPKPGV